MGLSAQAGSHTGLDQDLHFQEPRYLGDINEFRVTAMQLVASSLFQDATPVAGPIVELSFDEKVANAVAVIKRHILSGKRLIGACSFGKDSSVMVAITLLAMEQLMEAGFKVPEFHVMTSDTQVENPVVEAYSKGEIRSLKKYAAEKGLPVRIWVCRPNLSENWLVSIIGGRTVASLPGNSAKCQQQMKKAPLDRTKRQIRAVIKNEMGAAFKEDDLVVLIGTRRDESAVRERNMEARGESAFEPVNTAKEGEKAAWVLSPIADFTTMDIFAFLGRVTNGFIKTYSDFEALTEVYRDAAGECMVNVFLRDGNAERKTGCGARHGCWLCLRVQSDRSMENMLAEESGKYTWMTPLHKFRNYLKARHYDPKGRNWISRSINEETGTIKIAANAYSPELCLELLRYALTIDADEAVRASNAGEPARFQLLGMKEVLTIDLYWGRYSYQRPFTALNEYREILERGKRYYIPDEYQEFTRDDLDVSRSIEVPFVDKEFHGIYEGLRSAISSVANAESVIKKNGVYYTHVDESNEFDIDSEGVHLFYEFELDRALEYYGPHSDVCPSDVVHYLARFGTASFKKGGHSSWDKMLRIGNQLHRHGLRDILNDPDALIAKLTAWGADNGYSNAISAPISHPAPSSLVAADGQYLMSF
nr:phosphoadenosine phosphosulfate reductase family protein [Pseudomonas aeruginosa]